MSWSKVGLWQQKEAGYPGWRQVANEHGMGIEVFAEGGQATQCSASAGLGGVGGYDDVPAILLHLARQSSQAWRSCILSSCLSPARACSYRR